MRKLAFALAATLLAGLGAFAPAAAPAALAATGPKVAIIVGATHDATPSYRKDADQLYAEAIKYTPNVVKVYSPNATWSKVKAAVNGASIIVYLGHGNGWPSPYTYDPKYTTKDGFGLNYDLNGNGKLSDYELKYYGEPSIATLTPAPNAVVLLFHLCYASGNSEPQNADPSLSVARQRVDNYASAFLRAGARAVIADGHSHSPYYISALFTMRESIEQYWRNAPDFHNRVLSYASSRSSGYRYLMDPESTGKYYRSLTGKLTLNTADVTGAAYARTDGDPTTFVVPGNATPVADSAPVYGSVESAAAGIGPVTTLAATTTVRIEARESATARDGSAIFSMHTDDGVEGWMAASSLKPRDSLAPRLWEVTDGTGAFSPNGDGSQDSFTVSLRLSEPSLWTIRVLDSGGGTLYTADGGGSATDRPSVTWSPAADSVPDGTYTWSLEARDSWGNGPLEAAGDFIADTQAPDLSLADAVADTIPTFTPNGDGSRDTIAFGVGSTEPGTVVATARDGGGHAVDSFSVGIGAAMGTLTWDGRTSGGGYVPDGRYDISIAAKDLAGNASAPQVRTIDVYGSLGFVAASRVAFFPQDNDAYSRTVGLSFQLAGPATVTWAIVDAAGTVVRTLKSDEALDAGTWSATWDGRDDAGAFVPRGTYRSTVSATNGTQAATQAASVTADAFRIVSSDTTPGRGQKITVTATSAETLSSSPHLAVVQPGISAWAVSMTKVSTGVYRVTVTLKSSSTGTLRLKVYGTDSGGASQYANLYLPLH